MYTEKVASAPNAIYVITVPGIVAMKRIQGNTNKYQISSGIMLVFNQL
jgi:hypothetical protein